MVQWERDREERSCSTHSVNASERHKIRTHGNRVRTEEFDVFKNFWQHRPRVSPRISDEHADLRKRIRFGQVLQSEVGDLTINFVFMLVRVESPKGHRRSPVCRASLL